MTDSFNATSRKAFLNTHNPSADDADNLIDDDFLQQELKRMLDLELVDDDDDDDYDDSDDDDCDDDFELPGDDITLGQSASVKVEIIPPLPKGQARQQLNRLVGCQAIKTRIDEMIHMHRYNQIMLGINPNAKIHSINLHGCFLGRPGTGKTTLSKIYGSLLHEAGMLSRGHVVLCNRGTFIGGTWGDEEKAVKQVVEKARGGVLFFDEAYLLNSDNRNDPGKIILQLLMDVLADERQRDLAVILCGYKDETRRLFDLNPGLASRFPNNFEFPDFSVDELLEITRRRISEYSYHFTQQAWSKYKAIVRQAYDSRDPKTWGNARFVANQLEHIYVRHAQRCIRTNHTDRRHVYAITTADIESIAQPAPRPRVGF